MWRVVGSHEWLRYFVRISCITGRLKDAVGKVVPLNIRLAQALCRSLPRQAAEMNVFVANMQPIVVTIFQNIMVCDFEYY